MPCTIIAIQGCIHFDHLLKLLLGMSEDHQNMTMEELVDILAQKTQRFTQLLIFKDFGSEYKECKIAIKQILVEIENRKETKVAKQTNAG